jgi:alpha-2-macroglobulin
MKLRMGSLSVKIKIIAILIIVGIASCPQQGKRTAGQKGSADSKPTLPDVDFGVNPVQFPPIEVKTKSDSRFSLAEHLEKSGKVKTGLATPYISTRGFCDIQNLKPLIRIRFMDNMVAKSKIGKIENKPMVSMDPPWKGEFRWKTETQLNFIPASRWSHGKIYWLKIKKGTASLAGDILKKEYREKVSINRGCEVAEKLLGWDPVKGNPQLVTVFNCKGVTTEYDDKNTPYTNSDRCILFDQSVKKGRLKKLISVVVERGNSKKKVSFQLKQTSKMASQKIPKGYGYKLKIRHKLYPADIIRILFDKTLIMQNQLSSKYAYRYISSTKYVVPAPMRIKKIYCPSYENCNVLKKGNRYSISGLRKQLYVEYNSPLKYYSSKEIKKFISIIPKPLKFSVYSMYSGFSIEVKLKPGKRYTLRIKGNVKNEFEYGTKRGTTTVKIRAAHSAPIIKFPKDQIIETQKAGKLSFSTMNIKSFSVEIWPLDLANISQALDITQKGGIVSHEKLGQSKVFSFKNLKRNNKWQKRTVDFKNLISKTKKGAYLLHIKDSFPIRSGLSSPKNRRSYSLIQLTDLALGMKILATQSIFWVSSLTTGIPVENANISIIDVSDKTSSKVIYTGKTDKNGVLVIKKPTLAVYKKLIVKVISGKEYLAHIHERNAAVKGDKFKLGKGYYNANPPSLDRGLVFTERGIYRPGEKVYFKGIFRREGQGNLFPEKGKSVTCKILDPKGDVKKEFKLKTSEFGTLHGVWKSSKNFPTGNYLLKAEMKSTPWSVATVAFLVTPFRKPKFLVSVKAKSSEFSLGSKMSAEIRGKYLFGAPMNGAKLKWTLAKRASNFKPVGFEKYSFTFNHSKRNPSLVSSGHEILNGKGVFSWSSLLPKGDSYGPMSYRIEGEVQDIDRQTISSRKDFLVHPAVAYAGVRIVDPMVSTGKTISFESVLINSDGSKALNPNLSMKIYSRKWYWAWETDSKDSRQQLQEGYRDTHVHTCRLHKNQNLYGCSTKFKEPGYYIIKATNKDRKGNSHTSAKEFYVTGHGETSLKRNAMGPLGITLKKSTLSPGQMGKVMIPSPFNSSYALITVERYGVIYKKVVKVNKGATWVEFPVTRAMVPNAFVSVYLVKGRSSNKKDSANRDLGGAGYRIGYLPFNVKADNNRMDVKVSLSKKIAKPGEKISIKVKTSISGKGKTAEVALYVVDEGVLSLTGYKTPDPIKAIFKKYGLKLWTTDSRKNLLKKFNILYANNNPGGGGEDGDENNPIPPKPATRKNFKNTIYWNPALVTNSKGQAQVTITMPDNLSSFRVMAVAIDKKDHFGHGHNSITINKPFMLQPALPRYITVGDKFNASVIVHNKSGAKINARIELKVKNCVVSGPNVKNVQLHPGVPMEIKFPVIATTVGDVKFTFTGYPQKGVDGDSVSLTLKSRPVTMWQSHQVQGMVKGSNDITLKFPKKAIASGGEFSMELSNSSLTGLKDGLDYLVRYPYGCVEQTTSSTYPLLALMDLFPAMGVTRHSPEKLKKMAQSGIHRLSKMRTGSGGLSYWPNGGTPHLYGSAYAMLALLAAKEKGLVIPDDFHLEVAKYLRKSLRKKKIALNLKAYIIYVLSKTDKKDASFLSTIYDARKKLSVYGKSMLLMAMVNMWKADPRIESFAKELAGHFNAEGKLITIKTKKKARDYSMFSSIVKIKSAALMALLKAGGSNSLAVILASNIIKSRKKGYWYTTQQTIYALMSLSSYARYTSPGNSPLRVSLNLDGKSIDGKIININKRVKRYVFNLKSILGKKEPVLTIQNRGASKSKVFYTLRARYAVKIDPKEKVAYSRNLHIYKVIENLRGIPLGPKGVAGGELVKVRIFVHIPNATGKVKYLAIDDPIPAGLEALDPKLTTTSTISIMSNSNSFVKYGQHYLSFQELHEGRVRFFADTIYPGLYEFQYLARATSLGLFVVPPTSAAAMYDPSVSASSKNMILKVH